MNLGQKIPEFEIKDTNGNAISEKILKGKNVVIFFYPKDGSPICTTEACSFRDNYDEFKKYNCEVIGISSDSEKSHKKFAKNHNLEFPMVSDSNKKLQKLFEVKSSFLGIIGGRETFLIDSEGTIRLIFRSQNNANSHIEKTLYFLKKYIIKE
ncbi:MAG: peroxiredoxin [Bacteroidota bacterium]|nr:peroxiredoxin [Bacteroidota bacterium]